KTMKVYPLGPFYVHTVNMRRGAPILQISSTQETQYPYRMGRCLVLRIWTKGIVLGVWTGQAESEDLAMALAIGARVGAERCEDDGALAERVERRRARKNIAMRVASLDEEWEINDSLGLMCALGEDEDCDED